MSIENSFVGSKPIFEKDGVTPINIQAHIDETSFVGWAFLLTENNVNFFLSPYYVCCCKRINSLW
ncbi:MULTISPECIES: hypothetical protein [unclassified Campylobacter]|uniref:hypothetical protein n=1 Tax=unclassified Campylobacter TaxID=2593542 RepID=UPI0022E9EF58|nr:MULTISPECIES: hypothetical protein [unclassified Campylobacter]MDA3055641.1 hypothetical protein [Campylobacter sp. CN_NA1]MDA3064669.1 hypothetical protein [Campylobacter sp. CN_NE4]MDA3068507.1 hypothetical protein [Campylobacter sp. CN_NE3]MDA3082180.1 hypothetical protein [Campylobacter sp. CN_EL2]MDA3083815.1 hypothetical protein [Campylobacter sp. CN_NE1]